MDKIVNPHDKFVRKTLSRKEIAQDFLQNYLPNDVLEIVNLQSIEISKDSFIEKELKEYYSDLLYKVDFAGEKGYVYLLFEHKSHENKLTPLQCLGYIRNIWYLHIKQTKQKYLPLVIPLVLYHGRKKWSSGIRLSDLIQGPKEKLIKYIPDFEFVLYDLTQFSDNEIKGAVTSKGILLLLKHIFDPDIIDKLPKIFSFFKELQNQNTGLQYLETLLRYLFSTIDDITIDKIKDIMEASISDEKGDLIMTLAEKLRSEGYEKGIQKGVQQGIINSIEMDLELKFGDKGLEYLSKIKDINDITDLVNNSLKC